MNSVYNSLYLGNFSAIAMICKWRGVEPSLISIKITSFCFLTAFIHPCMQTQYQQVVPRLARLITVELRMRITDYHNTAIASDYQYLVSRGQT